MIRYIEFKATDCWPSKGVLGVAKTVKTGWGAEYKVCISNNFTGGNVWLQVFSIDRGIPSSTLQISSMIIEKSAERYTLWPMWQVHSWAARTAKRFGVSLPNLESDPKRVNAICRQTNCKFKNDKSNVYITPPEPGCDEYELLLSIPTVLDGEAVRNKIQVFLPKELIEPLNEAFTKGVGLKPRPFRTAFLGS